MTKLYFQKKFESLKPYTRTTLIVVEGESGWHPSLLASRIAASVMTCVLVPRSFPVDTSCVESVSDTPCRENQILTRNATTVNRYVNLYVNPNYLTENVNPNNNFLMKLSFSCSDIVGITWKTEAGFCNSDL